MVEIKKRGGRLLTRAYMRTRIPHFIALYRKSVFPVM